MKHHHAVHPVRCIEHSRPDVQLQAHKSGWPTRAHLGNALCPSQALGAESLVSRRCALVARDIRGIDSAVTAHHEIPARDRVLCQLCPHESQSCARTPRASTCYAQVGWPARRVQRRPRTAHIRAALSVASAGRTRSRLERACRGWVRQFFSSRPRSDCVHSDNEPSDQDLGRHGRRHRHCQQTLVLEDVCRRTGDGVGVQGCQSPVSRQGHVDLRDE